MKLIGHCNCCKKEWNLNNIERDKLLNPIIIDGDGGIIESADGEEIEICPECMNIFRKLMNSDNIGYVIDLTKFNESCSPKEELPGNNAEGQDTPALQREKENSETDTNNYVRVVFSDRKLFERDDKPATENLKDEDIQSFFLSDVKDIDEYQGTRFRKATLIHNGKEVLLDASNWTAFFQKLLRYFANNEETLFYETVSKDISKMKRKGKDGGEYWCYLSTKRNVRGSHHIINDVYVRCTCAKEAIERSKIIMDFICKNTGDEIDCLIDCTVSKIKKDMKKKIHNRKNREEKAHDTLEAVASNIEELKSYSETAKQEQDDMFAIPGGYLSISEEEN